MQQVHCLGCDWTDNRGIFLHQCTDIFISSIDAVTKMINLKNLSNVQISAHSLATIPTK